MNTLESLGLKEEWLYEVIISSYDHQVPHAAPFGMRVKNFETITLEIFKGSNTLKNILASKEFALNAVADPAIIYNALYSKEKIHFDSAEMINAPVLSHSSSSVEVKLKTIVEKKNRFLLEAEVVHITIRNDGEFTNRAKNIMLESLIVSTRKNLLPKKKLESLLKENYRVIKKVAPGSSYESLMHSLLIECLR
jgi:hypothetical protein